MPSIPSKAAAIARRKSNLKQELKATHIIILKLSPDKLRQFSSPAPTVKTEVNEESSPKESSITTPSAAAAPPASNGDKPNEQATGTPGASGTPAPSSSMPPPTEGAKKKGIKRTAAALTADGTPKVRGKPGPKKRPRLEDGSIDHSNTTPRAAPGTAAHKLGPKANQGAINAGLRALDRSGKPCRRWTKGSFTLKSFTGVTWEITRWKAPPKVVVNINASSQSSPSGDSGKDNKDNKESKNNNQARSEKSNTTPEVEKTVTSAVKTSPVLSSASIAAASATEAAEATTATTIDLPPVPSSPTKAEA